MKLFVNVFFLSVILCTCSSKATFTDQSFLPGVSKGILDSKRIDEASGLAASAENAGMLWTHNDSGNDPDLFLIDTFAHLKATLHLVNIENRDWEDIAVGPGPEANKNYIYIGDIGDNFSRHEIKYIYRIVEPKIKYDSTEYHINIIDSIKFRLPDKTRDTESLMVDPLTKDIFVVSKREEEVNLYKLPFPQSTTKTITAELVLKMPYSTIVAADISPDGSEVLIKSYNDIFYWKKQTDESIEDLMKTPASVLPYVTEPQGESITFDRTNEGYYTVSEKADKKKPHLMFYKRRKN